MSTKITLDTNLDVLPKFRCLMQEAMSSESVYIRAKETLDSLFREYSISSSDRATVISNVLGSVTSAYTTSAMQLAVSWATTEKELYLKKAELEKQLEVLEADAGIKENQKHKLKWEAIALQTEMRKTVGTPTLVPGADDYAVQSVSSEGTKVASDIAVATSQISRNSKEETVMTSKIYETHASIQKILADSFTNYGIWSYPAPITATGFTSGASISQALPGGRLPLSDFQRNIANQQAMGYAYNAKANALTATAGVSGTALASGTDDAQSLFETLEAAINSFMNVPVPPSLMP